jgi:hypothetical protein
LWLLKVGRETLSWFHKLKVSLLREREIEEEECRVSGNSSAIKSATNGAIKSNGVVAIACAIHEMPNRAAPEIPVDHRARVSLLIN